MSEQPEMIVFRIISGNGDDRLTWVRSDLNQVKEAREKFYELTEKGYRAFSVKGAVKGDLMDRFDPDAEEIILVPAQAGG